MALVGNTSMSLLPEFLDFVHANYSPMTGFEASLKAADSCSTQDNVLLGQSSALQNCYFSSVPTVNELNTCLNQTGISGNCRNCLIGVVSTIITCLNTCGYDGTTIANPPSSNCISCLTNIATSMQDPSQFLSTCGVDAHISEGLVSQLDPLATSTTTSKTATILKPQSKLKFILSLAVLSAIIM